MSTVEELVARSREAQKQFEFATQEQADAWCLSDRTFLRKQNGGVSLRQVPVCASSKHPKILHHHVTGRIFP